MADTNKPADKPVEAPKPQTAAAKPAGTTTPLVDDAEVDEEGEPKTEAQLRRELDPYTPDQPEPKRETKGARFQTTTAHYLEGDRYVESGAIIEVGRDVPEDWEPTLNLRPLDDAAKAMLDKRKNRKVPVESLPKEVDPVVEARDGQPAIPPAQNKNTAPKDQ